MGYYITNYKVRIICICFTVINSLVLLSQSKLEEQKIKDAKQLFEKGWRAYKKKNFNLADSLYTESIKNYTSAETYRCRAFVKREQNLYRDYCEDLSFAMKYGDTIAQNRIKSDCIVFNVFYIDSLLKKADWKNYKYSLVFLKYKYSDRQEYLKLDRSDEIIEGYRVLNGDTIYYNPYKYSSSNEEMKKILQGITSSLKYPFYEYSRKISGIVWAEINISSKGSISKINITSSTTHNFEQEALKALNTISFISPYMYKGRFVKSIIRIPIIFSMK